MNISIIIPTYNEADVIAKTVEIIRERESGHVLEILVADGGSTDQTQKKVKKTGTTLLQCAEKNRAAQMNIGARQARGDVLYFLHADSHPPQHFDASIAKAIQTGYDAGCFRLDFDAPHYALQFYSWFTRFNVDAFRFGDQSLFIERTAFFRLQGFREDHLLMEDQEMVRRIKQSFSFKLLDDALVTSARRYRQNGVLKLQGAFVLIFCLYYSGLSQERLTKIYNKLIN